MSRIGREPITVPQGVTIEVNNDVVTVKGPKGTLSQQFDNSCIAINVENGVATLTRNSEISQVKAKHGLYRALLFNMVKGVTDGYEKKLVVAGVGYKVAKQGNKLVLNVGFSHPIEFIEEDGVTFECPTITEIVVKGINKTTVGQVAANIRKVREPEPYHGYGIHYSDEVIERKEGKAAGK